MKRVKFDSFGNRIVVNELPKVRGKKKEEVKKYICESCNKETDKLIYPTRKKLKVCNRCFMKLVAKERL